MITSELESIEDVLNDIIAKYPQQYAEASKALTSLRQRGESDPIFRKRIEYLLGNLPSVQSAEEAEERKAYSRIVYREPGQTRSKRLVVRTTPEELITLHERAADDGKSLSDWARKKLGLPEE